MSTTLKGKIHPAEAIAIRVRTFLVPRNKSVLYLRRFSRSSKRLPFLSQPYQLVKLYSRHSPYRATKLLRLNYWNPTLKHFLHFFFLWGMIPSWDPPLKQFPWNRSETLVTRLQTSLVAGMKHEGSRHHRSLYPRLKWVEDKNSLNTIVLMRAPREDRHEKNSKTLNVLVDSITRFLVVRCISIGWEKLFFPLLLSKNRNMAAQVESTSCITT